MAGILDILTQPSALRNLLSTNPAYEAATLQQRNLQQVNPMLQQYLTQAQQTGPYQGSYQAAFDPTRMAGIQQQLTATGGQQQLAQAGLNTGTGLQAGLGTSQDILNKIATGQIGQGVSQSVLGSYQNPYLDANIQAQQREMQRQYQEQVAPGVSMAARRGGLTGVGATALGVESGQRLAENLSDIDARNRSAAYNAAYNAAVNAGANEFQAKQTAANTLGQQAVTGAQLTSELQRAQLAPGATREAAGVQFQNQSQAEIDAARQRQKDIANYGFDVIGQYGQAAGILGPRSPAPNINTLTNLGEIAQAFGLGGTGAGQTLQSQVLRGIGRAITGGGAAAVQGVQNILKSLTGGSPESAFREVRAQPGQDFGGYRYFTDAQGNSTVIDPRGNYYLNGTIVYDAQQARQDLDYGDYYGRMPPGGVPGVLPPAPPDNWDLFGPPVSGGPAPQEPPDNWDLFGGSGVGDGMPINNGGSVNVEPVEDWADWYKGEL